MAGDPIKAELERLRDTCRVKSADVVPKAQEVRVCSLPVVGSAYR